MPGYIILHSGMSTRFGHGLYLRNKIWTVYSTMSLPNGMIWRYFPLNLLAIVNSCQTDQPRPSVCNAAVGGWWLT